MAKKKTVTKKKKSSAASKKTPKAKKKAASTKKTAKTKSVKKAAGSASAKKATKKAAKKTAPKASKKTVKKTVKAKKAVKPTKKTVAKKAPKKVAPKPLKKTTRASSKKAENASNAEMRLEDFDMNTPLPPPVTPLNDEELRMFRQLLLEKRAEIAGDVSTLQSQALSDNRQNAAGDLSSMPIHMADIGSDNYEKEFTLGLLESERTILREIDEAIKRIDDRTYGVCEATGRPIGKARLKAQPWVKFCYEYVLAREKAGHGAGW